MNKKQLIPPILILFLTMPAFAQTAEEYLEQNVAYDKEGKIGQAIDYYTKAIEVDSNRIEAYYARAMDYYWIGEYDKSWSDVHKVQESQTGIRFPSQFIADLKNASKM